MDEAGRFLPRLGARLDATAQRIPLWAPYSTSSTTSFIEVVGWR